MPMYPDQPLNTLYPPAYSALLAVIWRFMPSFPANLTVLQLSSMAITVIFIILSGLALARAYQASEVRIALSLLLITTTPIAFQLSTTLGSDTLYGVLSLAAVLWIGNGAGSTGRLLLGSSCAVAAFYTRSVGFAIVVAVAVVGVQQWRQGARRRGAALLLPLGAILPWLAWTSAHGGAGYVQHWRQGVPGYFPPLANPGAWLDLLGRNLLSGHDSLWNVAPALTDVPLLGAVLMGWVLLHAWQRWQRTGHIVYCYLGGYLVLLLAWPWHVPGRYLWPVAALVAADALEGLHLVWQALSRRWGGRLQRGDIAIVASMLAFNAVVLATAAIRWRAEGWVGGPTPLSVYEAMFAAAAYLNDHVPPNAVLGTNRWDSSAWWWLYTGHQTLDGVARADGQGAFFLIGRPAGAPALVDYFIYQGDNGVPGADDRPTLYAELDERGLARTPVYCAPIDVLCVYDWRGGTNPDAP